MIRSMTGFANLDRQEGDTLLAWRVRSVNHRSLELHFHLPDGWDELEAQASRIVRDRLSRGRVDLTLEISNESMGKGRLDLDGGLLSDLLSLERRILETGGSRPVLSVEALLAWPGMVKEVFVKEGNGPQSETLVEVALTMLEETVAELVLCRKREGEGLKSILSGLLDELLALLNKASNLLPNIRDQFAHRFREKVRELATPGLDESRLSQELAFLLNRMDVAEERDRLVLHIQEFREAMNADAPAGRRLDFLCQELNREANTLCSKAQDGSISRLGVEMKVVIEKLREQVQNLE
ncbi:MAG: YicC family protein [Magnetococcales bacterium]|nr:YicC family protein [Magnetococcales bacterium]